MSETQKEFDWVAVKNLDDSQVELSGELPAEAFSAYRVRAIKKLGETAVLPGFRKGHVPENLLVKTIGENSILEEAAELALGELYPRIVLEKKLDVVGRPQIAITKMAPGNPLGFKITTAVMPAITLPDYKKLAGKALAAFEKETSEVSDAEFEDFLKSLLTQYAKAEQKEKHPDAPASPNKPELPELSDEFVKRLGDFENVAAFKTKAREHLGQEKARKLKEKKRLAITDSIIEKSEMALPAVFVESELEKMTAQFSEDIGRMGMKLEDYLKTIKKTIEELRGEWRAEAAKRAKLQLVLNEIAEKENIRASAEDIKRETDSILEHFKDADRERLHIYVESMLKNEATLKFLEEAR